MRNRWSLLGSAMAVLMVASCGGTGGTSSNKSPIKIGYIAPLTGTSASPGEAEKDGWNLGLKQFGDTANGRPIQTIFADSGGDPNVALSDARNLVNQDNVSIVEGPLLANEQAAVAAFLDPLKIPTDDLSECGYNQMQGYLKYGNAFSSGWTCNQPDTVAAEWMYNDLHLTHITTIGADYAFGWLSIGGFAAEFKHLGGTIDKMIWAPITTADFGPYVSSIPKNTQAVFAVTVGAGGPKLTSAYNQFGLKATIPLIGNTTVTDYSVLPAEDPSAILGVRVVAQYCDGIPSAINQKFANDYKAAYGAYPGYYADAGFTKARLAVTVLRQLKGDTSKPAAIAKALKATAIVAPRGAVKLSPVTLSPIQNIYVCQVENVNGSLRNVPIKTYPNQQPWGALSESAWKAEFQHDSTGRPTA